MGAKKGAASSKDVGSVLRGRSADRTGPKETAIDIDTDNRHAVATNPRVGGPRLRCNAMKAALKPANGPANTAILPLDGTKTRKKKKKNKLTNLIEEAGRTSRDAASMVLLKQGHDELNLAGNFSSDCFNSLIDEATGLLTMFTVYKPFSPKKLFLVSGAVYGFNVLVRFCIGLDSLLRPPNGSRLARDEVTERIFCTTWLRVFTGMILIMLEPVSGIRLLNSAFEPEPPLSEKEKKELDDSKQNAINVESITQAKIEMANKKLKEESVLNQGGGLEAAGVKAIPDDIRRAELAKQGLAVVEMEVAYLKKVAPLTQAESDAKMINAAVEVRTRKFELERARMKGTETVELQMAIFEDVPEIGVAVAFVAMGGLVNSTQSDVSLFITSLVVSLFHALKCFWSFWKLRKTIRAAKRADTGQLNTYESYFAFPVIRCTGGRRSESRTRAS